MGFRAAASSAFLWALSMASLVALLKWKCFATTRLKMPPLARSTIFFGYFAMSGRQDLFDCDVDGRLDRPLGRLPRGEGGTRGEPERRDRRRDGRREDHELCYHCQLHGE